MNILRDFSVVRGLILKYFIVTIIGLIFIMSLCWSAFIEVQNTKLIRKKNLSVTYPRMQQWKQKTDEVTCLLDNFVRTVDKLDGWRGGSFFIRLDAVKNFDGHVLLTTYLAPLSYLKQSQLLKNYAQLFLAY
jgi:hypothetical protein